MPCKSAASGSGPGGEIPGGANSLQVVGFQPFARGVQTPENLPGRSVIINSLRTFVHFI